MPGLSPKALAALLGMACLLPLPPDCRAAEEGAPAAVQKVIEALAKAYSGGFAKAAADLAHFPLENSVYAAPKTLSRTVFLKQFRKDPDLAKCLASERPQKDDKRKDTWAVACDQGNNIYYFGLRSGRWYYIGMENIAE